MTIGEALRRFRTEFKLNQDAVAEVLEVTRQAYSFYEVDKGIPPADKILKLATTFNVSADYLLGLTDKAHTVPTKTADEELINAVVAYRTATKTFDKFLAERGIE